MTFSIAFAARRSVPTLRTVTSSRFESTATQKAGMAAKQVSTTASELSAKAVQGLLRVSSAGPAIAGAAKRVASALPQVSGRTSKLVGFVERQIPHVVFWSKVGAELSKFVFRGQKMSPPPFSVFQAYFLSVLKTVQNPSALLATAQKGATTLLAFRSITKGQLLAGGVVLAECVGFFTAGEMLGRLKIVGYHGENHAAHH